MLAHKIQKPGNHSKERIQNSQHGKSLKSRKLQLLIRYHYSLQKYVMLFSVFLKHNIPQHTLSTVLMCPMQNLNTLNYSCKVPQ